MRKHRNAVKAVLCLAALTAVMGCGVRESNAPPDTEFDEPVTAESELATAPAGDVPLTEIADIFQVQIDLTGQPAAGDTVALPVVLAENDGFCGIGLELTYDNRILEFQGIELDGAFSRYQNLSECTELPDSNIVRVSYVFEQEIRETGDFALIRFTVKKDAPGESAAVNVAVRDLARLDGQGISGNEKCVQIEIGE